MKKIIPLLLLCTAISSFGMEVNCVHSIPITSVTGRLEGGVFVVHLVNHWGVKYMPLSTTPVSADDLEGLKKKAKVFNKLGDHFIFRWKIDNCSKTDEDLFSCSNGEETLINGVKVKPWGVYTKRIRSEIDIAELDELEVNFNLSIEGELQHLAIKYLRAECQQSVVKPH
jgi:hypothetical protein